MLEPSAFSSWLGKVLVGRLMEDEKTSHARDPEALRKQFLLDAENYKTALMKSEFPYQKNTRPLPVFSPAHLSLESIYLQQSKRFSLTADATR
jgi:hypothetical protein